jgi:transposase-like protein
LDEKYVKVKGKDHYDLNCIDSVTKYVTAHLFVEKRTVAKCKEFLSQIKITCYDQILERYKQEKHKPRKKRKLITFVSDGFVNYKTAWSVLFSRVSKMTHGVPIKAKHGGLKHNNNHIERYNGKIKDRLKVMRGDFYAFEGAEAFLNLNHIIHNFVNPHQQLKGKTPAEAAEIKLPLKRNKLLELIRYFRRHHIPKR